MRTAVKQLIMAEYDRGFLSFSATGFLIRSLDLEAH